MRDQPFEDHPEGDAGAEEQARLIRMYAVDC